MPLTAVQQTRLQEDLRGLIKGDVRCDEVTLQLFATDAGILQSRPTCVVYPRNTDDVIAVVRYAAEENIPIHPRGSGTSLTGESLGEGIVLAFSRYMRRILNTGDDFVTVQPGLMRRRLNGMLSQSQQHRRFGPLAGNPASATLGSILARNGAGLHYLRYGLPSDHLISMSIVLANGDLLMLDRQSPIKPLEALEGYGSVALAQEIAYGKEYIYAGKVARILGDRTGGQRAESVHQLSINRAGYADNDVLQGRSKAKIDLARLFTGSEGTLGLIVESTLRTTSMPQRKCAAAFFFQSIFNALDAVAVISPLHPVLCELIDRRRLAMVQDWDERYRALIPTDAEAALLVELDAGTVEHPASDAVSKERLSELIDLVQTKNQLSFHTLRVDTETDFLLFDQVIRRSELALGRMRQSIQPIPLFDDVAVPLNAIHDTVGDLLSLFQQHKITAALSGHIGQGHLRIHPLLDFAQPEALSVLPTISESVYATILKYGGTISSEWGCGMLKSALVPQQFPQLTPLFRKIKETFDPQCLLNPGKVIPDRIFWTQHLRHGLVKRGQFSNKPQQETENTSHEQDDDATDKTPSSQIEVQLKWEPPHVFGSAYRCNGCGECLRYDRYSRICPLFRGTPSIEASPRSKADLLRGVLEHEIELEALTREKAKEIADRCFHCRMCDIECPAEVDISMLAFRIQSAYAAARGLPLVDLVFARMDNVLDWLVPASFVVNMAMRNRLIRWIFEKTLQIPQSRHVPALAHRPFLHQVRKSPLRQRLLLEQTNKPRVALFVDSFANYFNPKIAHWAIQILEHNGFSVHVPARQRPSGWTAFSVGYANRAEKLARYNSTHILELIRLGYTIVTIEPYSTSCLTKDYRHVLESDDADLLAENVVDFCTLLVRHHREGKLQQDFKPLPFRAGYHAPCTGLAISASLATDTMPAEELLRLIPGLEVQRIEKGCCGMGGLWGFRQKNYHHSLQIGIPLFRALRKPEIDFGISDCIACCSQMAHGTKKNAFHPIRLLAAAYGLAPDNTLK